MITHSFSSEEIIIRLIRDHLINMKLVSGLNALGLHADDYYLYLGDTIFILMGLDKNLNGDQIFEKIFLGNSNRVKKMSIAFSMHEINKLSKEIYNELLIAKSMDS